MQTYSLSQEGEVKCLNAHLPQSLGSLGGVEWEGPDSLRGWERRPTCLKTSWVVTKDSQSKVWADGPQPGRASLLNPFVDFPKLVDYIWGEKSSQPYAPEQDEQEKERIPLRATYSVSTDEKIDLYSPYIPNDVIWTVNGVEISSESIETKSLGLGVHELRFESRTIKGKLKIKIVEWC